MRGDWLKIWIERQPRCSPRAIALASPPAGETCAPISMRADYEASRAAPAWDRPRRLGTRRRSGILGRSGGAVVQQREQHQRREPQDVAVGVVAEARLHRDQDCGGHRREADRILAPTD